MPSESNVCSGRHLASGPALEPTAHRRLPGPDHLRRVRALRREAPATRTRYKWHVHGPLRRARRRYWTIRAWVEGWVLLLVRRGPRAFWGRLTHAPFRTSLRFGFSTVAQGWRPEPDVAVVLTPPGTVEPDPSIISPRQVRNFVRTVAPGAPPDPRLDALVALEEEHGTSGLTGDPVSDAEGARTCGPYLSVDAKGRLSLRTRSIHRPPYEDAHLFEDPFSDSEPLFMDHDPLYDTDPLFDVVDVLLPLYLAATAISSGAYDRLLHLRGGSKRRRYHWLFDIEERIAFPTPRGGPSRGRIPRSDPGPDPSRRPASRALDDPDVGTEPGAQALSARAPGGVGPDRTAGPLGLRERSRRRGRGAFGAPEAVRRGARRAASLNAVSATFVRSESVPALES